MYTNPYTKYNGDTGEIIGIFTGSAEDAALNQPCIEGHWDKATHTVVNGVATPKPASEVEQQEISKAWIILRNSRNFLIQGCDWTQVPDAPVDSAAWTVYRQQLRDLPANTTDPRTVEWPVPPS
jgi:hypothetical protein